ncbi:MAG TPA: tetratricopeptide repeat protein [Candidatus Acidoferrum sp.]|nr:tetratricopeptide repeat protein [Candidatus Acidoferrum sp.]
MAKTVAAMLLLAGTCLAAAAASWAQRAPNIPSQPELSQPHLIVYVREANGGPVGTMALVTVTRVASQYWQQKTAEGGRAVFENVSSGRYSVQVTAGGYARATEEIDFVGGGGGEAVYVTMEPDASEGTTSAGAPGPAVLAPKAQKEMEKALEALRGGKMDEAHKHLDEAYRLAPAHPDVNFLFGLYASQNNDWTQAKAYWTKAVTYYPQHLLAQISLSDALLRDNKAAEAVPHLKKALEIDANSWRAHAFLADAELRMGSTEDAVREADRAIALGHEKAGPVQPLLARALAAQGNRERAMQVLESYLRDKPGDAEAQKQLAALRAAAPAAAVHP